MVANASGDRRGPRAATPRFSNMRRYAVMSCAVAQMDPSALSPTNQGAGESSQRPITNGASSNVGT
jgi:hypothetical protein